MLILAVGIVVLLVGASHMNAYKCLVRVGVPLGKRAWVFPTRSIGSGVDFNAIFAETMFDYKKQKAPKKVMFEVEDHLKSGNLTPTMALSAAKALVHLDRLDLLITLKDAICEAIRVNGPLENIQETTTLIARLYCRHHMPDLVDEMCEAIESERERKETQHAVKPDLIVAYLQEGRMNAAQKHLEEAHRLKLWFKDEQANSMLKHLMNHGTKQEILHIVKVLVQMNGLHNQEAIQYVTNYFLRNITFLMGAVSLEKAPPATCPEVCFIGRSNVGKSSLINMICNRKKLAYTSKTPGKTSEYNYFEVNGVVGVNKEPHRMYLVDLPGVGFAKRDKGTREGWTDFLRDYVTHRENLRAVYHLVDSRHGLMETDEECLSLLEQLPPTTQYVIVLTKVDKHGDGRRVLEAVQDTMASVRKKLARRTNREIPIIFTSAANKWGGVQLLSHLLHAVEQPVDVQSIATA